MLYEEATKAKVPVSLATVYNTLHQFTDVGLLRQVASTARRPISTPRCPAPHFFVEGEERSCSTFPDKDVVVGRTPIPPEGYEVARIDVVVRLRRKARGGGFLSIIPLATAGVPGVDVFELLHLLVRIDAPKLFLHDPTVEARSGDAAPHYNY